MGGTEGQDVCVTDDDTSRSAAASHSMCWEILQEKVEVKDDLE